MFSTQRKRPNQLITIPISHFCEKARWALEWCEIPYIEKPHLQGFHFLSAYRFAKTDSVPILVCKDGVLKDSTEILKWADANALETRKLFPSDPALRRDIEAFEDFLDEGLGVSTRLWMYTYLFDELPLIIRYTAKHGVPRHERMLLPLVFPILRKGLEGLLAMTERSRDESQRDVDAVFNQVAQKLSDGRNYLFGDQFTAADLTFAALAAAVLIPENYGAPLPQLSELPAEMAEQIQKWRAHPAGQFAARLYRDQRQ